MASAVAFQPHGLIKTPIEQVLYNKAHIVNVYGVIADPKEHETVALMTAILYSNIFTTRENFVVSNEQPPTPTSKFRYDIIVGYLESGSQSIRALCFSECKRASTSQPFSLKALEVQAFDYCKLYLNHERMLFVYAATMAGAYVRLWGCRPNANEMEPFWGPWSARDWSQYKDVGDDEEARQIEVGFMRMKRLPPTPHAGQSSDTYGTGHNTAMNYQATPPGFQATSVYQSAPYAVSYPVAGGSSSAIPISQYAYSIPGTETKPAQMSESNEREQYNDNEFNEGSEGMSEDMSEAHQTSGGADIQGISLSSAVSKYKVVRVTMKTHMIGSDDFIFKDQKGRPRSTKREDWKKVSFNGELAWMYSHYICHENHFK